MKNKIVNVKVADITFSLVLYGNTIENIYDSTRYHPFIYSAKYPSVILHLIYDAVSTKRKDGRLYELNEFQDDYRIRKGIFFKLIKKSYCLQFAIFDMNLQFGYLIIKFSENHIESVPDPFKMLIANLVSLYNGVMIHACGIKIEDSGIIFIGDSGSGKSTIAKLWRRKYDNSILSDECIIIRKIKKHFYIFGTPWHSDVREVNNGPVPLRGIFFIKHAKNNTVTPKNSINAVSSLLFSNSHITILDQLEIKHRLQFFDELINEIPCYELGFVPNNEVIKIIRDVI